MKWKIIRYAIRLACSFVLIHGSIEAILHHEYWLASVFILAILSPLYIDKDININIK